jgi:SAM-dependent methyltransferase
MPDAPNAHAKLESERRYFDQLAQTSGQPARYSDRTMARYRNPRTQRIFPFEYTHSLFRECGGQRVCDFGCGQGPSTTFAAARGARVFGFDISHGSLRYARDLAQVNGVGERVWFAQMDATRVAFADGAFDVVLCDGIFHHVDVAAALAEAKRILRPGGLLLINEPAAPSALVRRLRGLVPLRPPGTADESPLTMVQIEAIAAQLPGAEVAYFRIFGRIERLWPAALTRLLRTAHLPLDSLVNSLAYHLDRVLMTVLPFTRRLASMVVIAARR